MRTYHVGPHGNHRMQPPPQSLDQARRSWLAGLAREHAAQGTGGSALALARGHWMCGEYAAAIDGFVAACDLAPDDPETRLALVRAAAMVGRDDLAGAALAEGLRRSPASIGLQLHAALDDVPAALDRARSRLQPLREDPLCQQFAQALLAIISGAPAPPTNDADPRAVARIDGLRWVQRCSMDPQVHAGRPVDVLLRALAAAPAHGLTLECGVYFGRSLSIIAAHTAGAVHGFDSFQGLPEAWNANEGAGAYSTAGRLPAVAANVTLHTGWFEDTLPPFFAANPGPIRLLHIDCDLYSSTRTVLAEAEPRLVPGSVIVFDDLLGYPGYEQHELRAFEEFVAATGLRWELLGATLLGREVAMRITAR